VVFVKLCYQLFNSSAIMLLILVLIAFVISISIEKCNAILSYSRRRCLLPTRFSARISLYSRVSNQQNSYGGTNDDVKLYTLRDVTNLFKASSKSRTRLSPNQLLHAIDILTTSKERMGMIGISICMYHLRLYSSSYSNIRELLQVMVPKVKEC
jgi:hypothetical protein